MNSQKRREGIGRKCLPFSKGGMAGGLRGRRWGGADNCRMEKETNNLQRDAKTYLDAMRGKWELQDLSY